MSKEGVNFKTGVNVGKDISIDEDKKSVRCSGTGWRF